MADQPDNPDFRLGVSVAALDGRDMLLGHVDDEDVLLARVGNDIVAVGAHCTHYHGPLADGIVVDDTVRCPWHHACFSLRTGEAVRAPALDPIACWRVERTGDVVVVPGELTSAPAAARATPAGRPPPGGVVGGGGPPPPRPGPLRGRGADRPPPPSHPAP